MSNSAIRRKMSSNYTHFTRGQTDGAFSPRSWQTVTTFISFLLFTICCTLIRSNYRLGKYGKHEWWVFFKNRRRPLSHSLLTGSHFRSYRDDSRVKVLCRLFAGNCPFRLVPVVTAPQHPAVFSNSSLCRFPCTPFVLDSQVKQTFTCAWDKMNNAEAQHCSCFHHF